MPTFDIHTYLEGFNIPGVNQSGSQLKELLRTRKIDRAIVFSSRAAQADPLSGNHILKAMIENEPGLYGGVVIHLNRLDASLQAVRDLLGSKKMAAVMLTTVNPAEPVHPLIADEALNACRRYQKPIFLHTPNTACVEAALVLAKTYSMHKFIFLGMGGPDWRHCIAAAHQSVNIYLEMSDRFDRTKVPAAVEALGAHRILFGSSCPRYDPVAALGLLADSDIVPGDMRRILYDNAMKIINLTEADM